MLLCMVDPCLELLCLFTRLRWCRRIRNFKWTRKSPPSSDDTARGYELTALLSPRTSFNEKSNNNFHVTRQAMGIRNFHDVRKVVLFFGFLNWGLTLNSIYAAVTAASNECPTKVLVALSTVAVGAALRIMWMVGMGITQAITASAMISEERDSGSGPASSGGSLSRKERRRWYRWWLWWSRTGFVVTFVQVVGAAYVTFLVATKSAKYFSYSCSSDGSEGDLWFQAGLVGVPVVSWVVALAHCCLGSDVITWRLLYHDHDEAWRAHYREMFDYGIREFMCCLGRRRYLSQLEKDEVDSVAALLGDLVAYRARVASHLEVVDGVDLLREQQVQPVASGDDEMAPESLLGEATLLHPYGVAAYTGFLLDVGRNPFTFPCVWLHRQGLLTFWNRNRRPKLEGDNWWRGHAAAFLRHARVPPEALRKGRVSQTNRETVYFVVVLHHLRSVVVAVRGTETPEDLLTNGLGRECELSKSDLLGLLKGAGIPDRVRKQVEETMPHYGHVGVIQAARELSMQLDNLAEDDSHEQAVNDCPSDKSFGDCEVALLGRRQGLLTELLGPGGECEGYSLRFVGHSLGGSIAALTALRLYRRYPELHVYAYGVLPCVDAVTADACASFVTSVIYNDEFSSRLSVAAIMRALATDPNTDSALLTTLTRSLFGGAAAGSTGAPSGTAGGTRGSGAGRGENPAREHARRQRSKRRRPFYALKCGLFLCLNACYCVTRMPFHRQAVAAVHDVDLPVADSRRSGCPPSPAGLCLPADQDLENEDGAELCETLPQKLADVDSPPTEKGASVRGGAAPVEMVGVRVTIPAHKGAVLGAVPSKGVLTSEGFARVRRAEDGAGLRCEGVGVRGFSHRAIGDCDAGREVTGSEGAVDEASEGEYEEVEEAEGVRGEGAGPAAAGSRRHPGDLTGLDLLPNGMPRDVENELVGHDSGSDLQALWPAEMFVPGLVIHLVKEEEAPLPPSDGGESPPPPSRASSRLPAAGRRTAPRHRAVLKDRTSFRDIVVSPDMFLDHMPWRCQHAMNEVVKRLRTRPPPSGRLALPPELV